MSGQRTLFAAIALAWAVLSPSAAQALAINVSFRSSTYAVQAGDTYADLMAEHNAGGFLGGGTVLSLDGVSTAVHAPGNTTDYSVLMTVDLTPGVTGTFDFRAGVDWGRGGIAAVINNTTGTVVDEYVRTDDLWWANNWNHSDVFTTSLTLDAGDSYTLAWIGFEGCCAGASTIQYSFNGSAFASITDATLGALETPPAPASVPEPGASGLAVGALLALAARRARPGRSSIVRP